MKRLVVIGGPTASGKSDIACRLAQEIGGEIISADSMAVYRGLDVGTAKPKECMKAVKHHLIDVVDPGEHFDAKLFESMALKAIRDIESRDKIPIVVGGTYLYLQALLYGIEDTPEPNWKLRKKLYDLAEEKGGEWLYNKLRIADPVYARKIHPKDTRRIVRALEVFIETGRPFSSYHRWGRPRLEFKGFYITRDWESLSQRIEKRVMKMIEEGLVDEVRELLKRGFERFITSSQAIGYKELVPYLKGEISLEEAIRQIVRNTKDYAKRQIRWFRRQGWEEINLDRLSEEEASTQILRSAGLTPLSL